MSKTVSLFLAEGFEEIEAIVPIDLMRRASLNVSLFSITESKSVKGAHGVTLVADGCLSEKSDLGDALFLPGGMPGSANLAAEKRVITAIQTMISSGKIVSAICAAPALVLGEAGKILTGKSFTCYPGMEGKVSEGKFVADKVVRDGNIITSRGPGTAAYLAASIIGTLVDEKTAQNILKQSLFID